MQARRLHRAEWGYVRTLLPSELEHLARQTPAPRRCRNVPDAAALMRLASAYGPSDFSLQDIAAWVSTPGGGSRSRGQACFTAYQRPRLG